MAYETVLQSIKAAENASKSLNKPTTYNVAAPFSPVVKNTIPQSRNVAVPTMPIVDNQLLYNNTANDALNNAISNGTTSTRPTQGSLPSANQGIVGSTNFDFSKAGSSKTGSGSSGSSSSSSSANGSNGAYAAYMQLAAAQMASQQARADAKPLLVGNHF